MLFILLALEFSLEFCFFLAVDLNSGVYAYPRLLFSIDQKTKRLLFSFPSILNFYFIEMQGKRANVHLNNFQVSSTYFVQLKCPLLDLQLGQACGIMIYILHCQFIS